MGPSSWQITAILFGRFIDAEDEEVERIIDSDRADAHSQEKDMKDSVVASSEDAVKGQKPWNKFRFGNRKQQLQDEQVQEHDATLASSETTAAEPAIGRGAKVFPYMHVDIYIYGNLPAPNLQWSV